MTIDELAAAAGTTTRHVRSLQTIGLLPRPELRARTGQYGVRHLARLVGVLRLQDEGFSLRSLSALFAAHDRGESLASVLGMEPAESHSRRTDDAAAADADSAELYGFAALEQRGRAEKPLLWVVPTTMWDDGMWDDGPTSGVA